MGIRSEENCCQFLFLAQFFKNQNFYYYCTALLGEFPRVFLAGNKTFFCYSLIIYYVSRREHLLPTDFEGWIFLS